MERSNWNLRYIGTELASKWFPICLVMFFTNQTGSEQVAATAGWQLARHIRVFGVGSCATARGVGAPQTTGWHLMDARCASPACRRSPSLADFGSLVSNRRRFAKTGRASWDVKVVAVAVAVAVAVVSGLN